MRHFLQFQRNIKFFNSSLSLYHLTFLNTSICWQYAWTFAIAYKWYSPCERSTSQIFLNKGFPPCKRSTLWVYFSSRISYHNTCTFYTDFSHCAPLPPSSQCVLTCWDKSVAHKLYLSSLTEKWSETVMRSFYYFF